MRFIGDLHIHSRYSRATSKDMSPEVISKWAQIKGLTLVGTGDFTHPAWLKELKEKLEPLDNGLFRLKKQYEADDVPESCSAEVFFMPSSEISSIYSKNGRLRRVHSILLAPDFEKVELINKRLSKIGNLEADGRPILGLDAKKLLQIVLDVSPSAMLIPAHAWTPHFSVFGAFSGFDSLGECFDELTPYVYAIETGLSSDPAMNWRISSLDGITLTSHSDAHSPQKLAREANIFEVDVSYENVINAIKTKAGLSGTIEFFPEEGKYHWDGHRLCGVSMPPEETIKNNYLCPLCGKKLTIGVMHRIERLSDTMTPALEGRVPFHSIIPLAEIIGEVLDVGVNSKAVGKEYFGLINALGNELKILMDVPLEEIKRAGRNALISSSIGHMRKGDVTITPGFDGEYGNIKISGRAKTQSPSKPPKARPKKGQVELF